MNSASNTIDSSVNCDDLATGHKVISWALRLIGWGLTIAVTWSCSSFMLGLLVFICMSLLVSILGVIAHMALAYYLSDETVAGLGRTVGGTAARVTGIFSRKASA